MTLRLVDGCPDSRAALIAALFEEEALASSCVREDRDHRRPWLLSWLFAVAPDLEDMAQRIADVFPVLEITPADLSIERHKSDKDWLTASYQQFHPFEVGGFYIYGSHENVSAPQDKTGLCIDAATAFGSGEHGTTAGCLRLMESLKNKNVNPAAVLDMGTGSGILAVAAALLWAVPVLATDIDPEAVRLTAHHARLNQVEHYIDSVTGDGFAVPAVPVRAPYDLVLANILAGPLIDMAQEFSAILAPGGRIILSGMLTEQAAQVLSAYESCGLWEAGRDSEKGWVSLLLQKPA